MTTWGIYGWLLAALQGMKASTRFSGEPQLSNNPGDHFTGRSNTFKKNLRKVQKAQRRRAFYRPLRK